jgi:hypothetical protein
MFHPNPPPDSDDDSRGRESEAWQKTKSISLSTVLGRRETCRCCRNITQLLEDRLKAQDTIPRSLLELGDAEAEVVVGYRNELALRPDRPGWELTRLEIGLKLPEAVVEALRTKFGVSSHLDILGPNVLVVLQRADNEGETMEKALHYRKDFDDWSWGTEFEIELTAELMGEGRLRPCVFNAEVAYYWKEFCEEKHKVHRASPCWTPPKEPSFTSRLWGFELNDPRRVRE